MKKRVIIAGAASLAVAAMPVVGVFAENYGEAVVDQIQVTVNRVCNMTSNVTPQRDGDPNGTYSKMVTPGTLIGGNGQSWEGTVSTMSYTCNDAGGWKVTAQGVAGVGSSEAQTALKAESDGTDIVTGTATDGDTSNWAFRVTGTGASFTSFAEIPGTTTTVASSADSVASGTLTPEYRVWISPLQEADTYTGYVKYILSAPL